MRVLVTGGNGFVGRHLCAALRAAGDEVYSVGRTSDGRDVDLPLELSDPESVLGVVQIARPQVIYHLAAIAFVPDATDNPVRHVRRQRARHGAPLRGGAQVFPSAPPRCIYASSAEVYGVHTPGNYPLYEGLVPRPTTPYAASKLGGEAVALAASHTYGIPTVISRAFNHVGPGQDERFAVPAFAKGLAQIANGAEPILAVGNLEARRDFLDVRDVVSAYIALARDGADGEIYNVCSGRAVGMAEVLRTLISTAARARRGARGARIDAPQRHAALGRRHAKLRAATGWNRAFADRSLHDVYEEAPRPAKIRLSIAYFELVGGASGNMLLGALIDAGSRFRRASRARCGRSRSQVWTASRERTIKRGIAADLFRLRNCRARITRRIVTSRAMPRTATRPASAIWPTCWRSSPAAA